MPGRGADPGCGMVRDPQHGENSMLRFAIGRALIRLADRRLKILSTPQQKFETGTEWHSWDGNEWWRGEPTETTRSLTIRKVGSLAALAVFERSRVRSDLETQSIGTLSGVALSPGSSWGLISESPRVLSQALRYFHGQWNSFRALWSDRHF
jgi:hypothetical protein